MVFSSLTFSFCRERGSYDVADNLLAAAEKNWEAHLRTQALMSKRQSPRVLSTSAPSPRFTHKEIIEKPKEKEICNKENISDNVAEKKLDEIKVDTEVRRSRSRQTSGNNILFSSISFTNFVTFKYWLAFNT